MIAIVFAGVTSFGQVANNDIGGIITLQTDAPALVSTTDKATVEWSCINRKLTNKCLVYHNDQWFMFIPPVDGRYFINLNIHSSRDARGIQASVIEGNPCETATYRIVSCLPQIQLQQSFIVVDSMKANTTYLINIDGFLGDVCGFDIQFATTPAGVRSDFQRIRELGATSVSTRSTIELFWKLPVHLRDSVESFSVYREQIRGHLQSLRDNIAVSRNTRGDQLLEYRYLDSLTSGRPYRYIISGNLHGGGSLVMDQVYPEPINPSTALNTILFKHYERDGSSIQLLLIDPIRDKVLLEQTFQFKKVKDEFRQLNVSDYVAMGMHNFSIVINNTTSGARKELIFHVDDRGKVTSRRQEQTIRE